MSYRSVDVFGVARSSSICYFRVDAVCIEYIRLLGPLGNTTLFTRGAELSVLKEIIAKHFIKKKIQKATFA